MDHRVDEVEKLVKEIGPILHGKEPGVQSAVLADLFAMWLAGHYGVAEYREQVIANRLRTVRKLVPINEKIILECVAKTET